VLIKHEKGVINLDNVTDFYCVYLDDRQMVFNHNFSQDDEVYYTSIYFDTKEERDQAYEEILNAYERNFRIIDLTTLSND
jgi:hypothetical protein